MSAVLPERETEECPQCGGFGTENFEPLILRCNVCGGWGHLPVAAPPPCCPFCFAPTLSDPPRSEWRTHGRRYRCLWYAGGSWSYHGTQMPALFTDPARSTSKWGDHVNDGRCPATKEDVAAVLKDLAAERGLDLLGFLIGDHCEWCKGGGEVYVAHDETLTRVTTHPCPHCFGPGRINVDSEVAELLAVPRAPWLLARARADAR